MSLMEAHVDPFPEFTLLSALQMIYKITANSNKTHQMSIPLGEICSQIGGGQIIIIISYMEKFISLCSTTVSFSPQAAYI